ncbi:MAG TPA: hypothetical protein VFS43_40200 [Polyangiaceae bacterium]|nr:hypothetical protein [Polyangiaceae bacterium]
MRTSSFVRSTRPAAAGAIGASPVEGGIDATNAAPDLAPREVPTSGPSSAGDLLPAVERARPAAEPERARAAAEPERARAAVEPERAHLAVEPERASDEVFTPARATGGLTAAPAEALRAPEGVEPAELEPSFTPPTARPEGPPKARAREGAAAERLGPGLGRRGGAGQARPWPALLGLFAQRARDLMRARMRPEAASSLAQRAADAFADVYAFVVAAGLSLYLFGELYVRHAHLYLQSLPAPPPAGGLFSAEVLVACSPAAVVCALPTLLSYSLIAAGQRSLETRLNFDVPGGPSSQREAEWAPAYVEARLRWRHEAAHVVLARKRIAHHGRLYGLLVSLLLGLCAMIAAPQVLFGRPPSTQPEKVALAVATALLINFARDVGRMAVRAANRDASSRMLAWNIKRLMMTAVGTLLLSGLAFAGSLPEALQGPAGWLLIGGAMALFADQVMDAVGDRFAALFGVKRPPQDDGESLRRLDGMGEDDLERLGEEGIDSAHALAMCSTAKLFFNTPYALQRICDWQDQALLVVRLGEPKARLFREQLQLRGAIDAQRLAADFLRPGRVDDKQREDLVKVLGFASEPQARMVLERLACDDMIRQLACFRKALPFDVDAGDAAAPLAAPGGGR